MCASDLIISFALFSSSSPILSFVVFNPLLFPPNDFFPFSFLFKYCAFLFFDVHVAIFSLFPNLFWHSLSHHPLYLYFILDSLKYLWVFFLQSFVLIPIAWSYMICFYFLNWSVVDLQCFRWTSKWFIYIIYIHISSDFFHYRLLQNIEDSVV